MTSWKTLLQRNKTTFERTDPMTRYYLLERPGRNGLGIPFHRPKWLRLLRDELWKDRSTISYSLSVSMLHTTCWWNHDHGLRPLIPNTLPEDFDLEYYTVFNPSNVIYCTSNGKRTCSFPGKLKSRSAWIIAFDSGWKKATSLFLYPEK